MTDFSLDKRLVNDCHVIKESEKFYYLLHENAEVAWFIIVPDTDKSEFFELDSCLQNQLCERINQLSEFIREHFDSDKINVATIGNVVSQMHVHVIGRRRDDVYWPDVVWGRQSEKRYSPQQLTSIKKQFISQINQ